jgi:hypothetical protein
MRVVSVLLVFFFLQFQAIAETPRVKYVDAQTWVSEVHRARKNGESVLELEKYTPELIREYVLHLEPRPNRFREQDLWWKRDVLCAYGQMKDLAQIRQTILALQQIYAFKPEIQSELEFYQFVIPARHGDEAAWQRIRSVGSTLAMSLLRLCRSELLREKFVGIATDQKEDILVRCTAVYNLAHLGDSRSLEIALSEEFVAAVRAQGDIRIILSGMTGIDEIRDAPTIDEARRLIKERSVQFPVIRERISVKGGIDWSKVKWEIEDPLETLRKSNRLLPDADAKQCPYCGERIRRSAPICPFCVRELAEGSPGSDQW